MAVLIGTTTKTIGQFLIGVQSPSKHACDQNNRLMVQNISSHQQSGDRLS